MEEALKHYNHLLSNGYLLDLFPDLTGDWEQDKKDFTAQYEDNQKLLNGEDLTINDEDDEDTSYGFDD